MRMFEENELTKNSGYGIIEDNSKRKERFAKD